jgi:hypothetical protein
MLTVAHRSFRYPTIHPGLVAAFQLGASLFVLVAFPTKNPSAVSDHPSAFRG